MPFPFLDFPRPAAAAAAPLNRVPEITLAFWAVKVMATTVGETAADYLNTTLGFGLNGTSMVMSVLLLLALAAQFRARRYLPGRYWLVVVLISVVGTLISDNLVDNLGVGLLVTTPLFAFLLAVAFAAWFGTERTLSVHTIFTARREAFYWAAILFTFALGTSGGDLLAERLALGYPLSAALFGLGIAATYGAWRLGGNPILTFWIAYILTRPLGASLGDLLSQPRAAGGLGFGTTMTSLLFLLAILALVAAMGLALRRGTGGALEEGTAD